jgi:hypothetical protein
VAALTWETVAPSSAATTTDCTISLTIARMLVLARLASQLARSEMSGDIVHAIPIDVASPGAIVLSSRYSQQTSSTTETSWVRYILSLAWIRARCVSWLIGVGCRVSRCVYCRRYRTTKPQARKAEADERGSVPSGIGMGRCSATCSNLRLPRRGFAFRLLGLLTARGGRRMGQDRRVDPGVLIPPIWRRRREWHVALRGNGEKYPDKY